jgi:hypothetical protein
MGRACSTNGERRKAYLILVGKPEGKRPPGRPRRRWVDNIKIGLREIGWDDIDWIDLAQDRGQWRALVNTVMNHILSFISVKHNNIPMNSLKFNSMRLSM